MANVSKGKPPANCNLQGQIQGPLWEEVGWRSVYLNGFVCFEACVVETRSRLVYTEGNQKERPSPDFDTYFILLLVFVCLLLFACFFLGRGGKGKEGRPEKNEKRGEQSGKIAEKRRTSAQMFGILSNWRSAGDPPVNLKGVRGPR